MLDVYDKNKYFVFKVKTILRFYCTIKITQTDDDLHYVLIYFTKMLTQFYT